MRVHLVDSTALRRRFMDLPYRIYRRNHCWIPPLRAEMAVTLSPKKNPFFKHVDHALFLASDGSRDVGRIAVFHNRKHNNVYKTNIGMFGFLEMINDPVVTTQLVASALEWLRPFGAMTLRGPFNPDINSPCGMLLDAYDQPPMVYSIYNNPYYPAHLEALNFSKVKDMLGYDITAPVALPGHYRELSRTLEQENGFTVRKVNLKKYSHEIEHVKQVYREAWSENWGALPLDDEEFSHLAKELKVRLDPDMTYMAEVNGAPVGFSIAIPNINEALAHLPNGRLFPFGWARLLWHESKLSSFRVFAMGVTKPFRSLGIDSAFYWRTYETGLARGFRRGEMSWVFEENSYMLGALQKIGARKVKTWRIFERKIDQY
ncbi:hypothetical protein ACFLZR_00435 [Candidatus Neomarinimicrobiota bacterium]